MSRTIWKYPLPNRINEVWMPLGCEPLSVGEQLGVVHIWVYVPNQQAVLAPKAVSVACTGDVLRFGETHENYVGTCQCRSDILHVFFSRELSVIDFGKVV